MGYYLPSQTYKIWTGFAFENLCRRHISQIKKMLGVAGVYTEHYSFKETGTASQKGIQIDLIIDRKDNVINLCECKFYNGEFVLSKPYADGLRERLNVFKSKTKTKKNVFNTLITAYGVAKNEYYLDVIDNDLTIDDLMIE